MRPGSVEGRLLVATPMLGDPNFERTVVLMLEHNEAGALGLVLNRPSDVALFEPLPEWGALAAAPPVVFVGGPVEQGAAIGLGRRREGVAADGFNPVLGPIGTLDLSLGPDELAGIEAVRVFAGYAGWGPGQLEGELALGSWFVVDAEPDDVLAGAPDELWSRVLRRQGGDLALVSRCPPDPSLN